MKKRLSFFLAVIILTRIFSFSAAAGSNDEKGWSPTEAEPTLKSEQPFWVEQVDQAHRYAVDVEYQDMTIYVKSAIWDVNNYQYVVEMVKPTNNDGAFDFLVTVYNHSDLPIKATVSIADLDSGLTSKIQNDQFELAKVEAGAKNAESKSAQISITPNDGWQAYINSLIARGVPEDYVCPVGTVNLVVSEVEN